MASPRRKQSRSNRIAAAILYVGLAGAPLLFGARDDVTIATWCAILGIGLVFASPKRLQRGHLLLLAGIAVVVVCFGFVLHEQLSDHPWIAPFNPVWAKASEALGRELTPSVSIVRGEPFFALGPSLANVLALTLGLIVGVDSDRARLGVRVMAWAGVVYAVYGIFALVFDPHEILWREKTSYVGNLTATFINRNTAATYFGSCSAVWLVLLMAAIRRNLPRPIQWKKAPQRLLRDTHKDVLIRFVALFVCLSAMFMTSSRGGVLISLSVMIMSFMIYFGRDMPRGLGFVIALVASVATGLLLLQVLGGNVGYRIEFQGLSDAGRLSVYRSTLKIIADNPWFGTGLGTFAEAFPAYRSDDISMQGVWGRAHNTHLEFASEMGIPLTIVVAIAWTAALALLASATRGLRRDLVPPLSAFGVAIIALAHSTIDFSLQVVGYSIVVFGLLGLGLAQAVRGDAVRAEDRGRLQPESTRELSGIGQH